MKTITIKQPWATLIAEGRKDVENRPKPWNHRGRVAIHSSQTVDWAAFNDPEVERTTGYPAGTTALMDPRFRYGHVLAVAILADCHPATSGCCRSPWARPDSPFHLRLTSVVQLARPVYASGRLGPWDLPPLVQVDVIRQLSQIGAA